MKWDWEKFYDRAFVWLITNGPKILAAIAVLFIGLWLIRIANRWTRRAMERRKLNPSIRYFLENLIAIILQILLVLMVMQIAGIQLTFFTAIVAGLSVAAGLALSGTLQNFVSGVLILLMKPYRVGENINIQNQEGTVTAIKLFFTTVLTFDNKTIIIPNGQLSNNVVINLSREGKRRLDVDLKFSYGIDFDGIKSILQRCLDTEEHMLTEPASRIGISALEPDRYTVSVNVWTNAHGFNDNKMLLLEKIMKELKNSGIKLPGM
jgi:small conductance mechanosensitive channel